MIQKKGAKYGVILRELEKLMSKGSVGVVASE